MKSKELAAGFRALAQNAEKIETAIEERHPLNAEKIETAIEERHPLIGTADELAGLIRQRVNSGGSMLQDNFTCNAILFADGLGYDARRPYIDLFELHDNQSDLWDQSNCPSIRVLMLCFAAALAEAGDFE